VRQFDLLTGRYETAFMLETPDDETIMTAAVASGPLGSVSSETMRAVTEDDIRKMVAALPWAVV
jgi:uncharacterized protein with GYD domain